MLDEAEVVMYQGSWRQRNEELTPVQEGVLTPVQEGALTPAHEELTPATADLTPAQEGVDTTKNTTEDITRDITESVATAGAVSPDLPTFELRLGLDPLNFQEIESSRGFTYFLSEDGVTRLTDTTTADTPATAGVKQRKDASKAAQDWVDAERGAPLTEGGSNNKLLEMK